MFTLPQKIYLAYVGALGLYLGGVLIKSAYDIGKAKGALDQLVEDDHDYLELMKKYVEKCKQLNDAQS